MKCTTGSHIWLWSSAGSAPIPDHVPCQCYRYTFGEWRSLEAMSAEQAARIAALEAERDALRAAMRETAYELHMSHGIKPMRTWGDCDEQTCQVAQAALAASSEGRTSGGPRADDGEG